MNRQVTRVAWTAMALIVALILGTTYWQTWARPGLAARQDNEIQRVAEFQVRRGLILAPGRVLARNRDREAQRQDPLLPPLPAGQADRARRRLLDRRPARAGLEKSMNGVLTGRSKPRLARRAPARRGPRKADRRRHGRHDARPPRAAGRARAAGPHVRRRGRARSAQREAARDGVVPELQPEPRRDAASRRSGRSPPTADPPRRSSTARRRASTRRARRSRW